MNPASMPSVAIPRSRFLQEFTHSTSMLHGDLIPVDCFPVLPGDDFSVKKAGAEVIMSTPIAPIFGNIKMKVCAFFVPMRLLWAHTEEFFGANKTSAGPQTTTYLMPARSLFTDNIVARSVSHYLGKPISTRDSTKANAGLCLINVLKERAYWFIWSEWYRAQQLQNPFILNTGDLSDIGTLNGSNLGFDQTPAKVCKQYDLFTAATLAPQYGAAVTLPLGTYAPVGIKSRIVGGVDTPIALNDTNFVYTDLISVGSNAGFRQLGGVDNGTPASADLFADLSQATAAKINDIRYAFQLQKYLERANFGTRFFEVLAVHYGVTSPDSRLQRPEYLGAKSCPITVRTVLSQSGYSAGTGQQVGQLGAASITYVDLSGLFSKGFVEPGYVMILASTSHERLYSQGIMREDSKRDRMEIYSPEFANLGDQAIKNKEIFVTGDATDEQVFGYQGHWDEYRYRKNRVSGILDPAAPSALDFWTLAEKFASRPSLSASFIEENRDNIARCLVTGSGGPDYISDWYIEYAATREMPLYNIPGLIDHFGAL